MSILENIANFFTKIFGSRNDRMIKSTYDTVERINDLEPKYAEYTDAQLKEETEKFKKRLKEGETLDDILCEAFAVVREGSKRYLGMRHFDVQMIGGYFLHQGKIVEMVTGEGKTLVATAPAYLNALKGEGVHVVTVNDYLARRDRDWNAPLFEGLGLTVGVIQSEMHSQERIEEYACDITYGTNNEFGFDYLRDNMKMDKELQCQRKLNFAIIDEVDSVLIDEARTPLIISGPAEESTDVYYKANKVAKNLRRGPDYEVKEKERAIILSEEGMERAEKLAHQYANVKGSLYSGRNGMIWPHALDNALSAKELYQKDKDYMVRDGKVVIIDEFTGRAMEGRTWSDGLHQAIEAKEGLRVQEENQTLATITFQNFFRLYDKLSGMTGTAFTEATEFLKIYELDVVVIPTNKPLIRDNKPDRIYGTIQDKYEAIAAEIDAVHSLGRPILVGTVSIENSELLSELIKRRGIPHEVLNAKRHEREANIVEDAGHLGKVTIATNMAGRGTDIVLGKFSKEELLDHWKEWGAAPKNLKVDDPEVYEKLQEHWEKTGLLQQWIHSGVAKEFTVDGKTYRGMPLVTKVKELGGLHVMGTERHDSRRIDNQLRGRCGRQGDPGSSRFFLSLEDDLMRIFMGEWVQNFMRNWGLTEGQDISHPMVTRALEKAQKKVEGHNFEIRKHLLDYDKVMDEQRTIIYNERQAILDGQNMKPKILRWIREDIGELVEKYIGRDLPEDQRDYEGLMAQIIAKYNLYVDINEFKIEDETFKEPEELVPYLIDYIEEHRAEEIEDKIERYVRGKTKRDVEIDKVTKEKVRNWANTNQKLEIDPEDVEHMTEVADVTDFLLRRLREMELYALTKEEKEKLKEIVTSKLEKAENNEERHEAARDIREWIYSKYEVPLLLASFYRNPPRFEEPAKNIFEKIKGEYDKREEEMGEEEMRQLEGYILLQKIDEKWKDHLRAMDELKSSIGMRGFGQKDPKIEYKREGYQMFEEMNHSIREEVTDLILKLTLVSEEEMVDVWNADEAETIHEEYEPQYAGAAQQAAEQPQSEGPTKPIQNTSPDVGRNDPCPCGSGMKYKKCHGG